MIGTSSARLVSAPPANPITPNVLVVDDDAVVRDLMVRLYLDDGYSVVGVSSAEQALRLLAERNIDFVITRYQFTGNERYRIDSSHPGELF